jgi:hypothetical protein
VSAADRYTEWDAAYVLGSLSPDERGEFEQHLAGCDRCRAAVGELAGMPGLLAQVPPAEAWALASDDLGPPRPTEPPVDLPLRVEVPRPARRPWWQLAAAAVLVAVLGGFGGYGLRTLGDRDAAQRLAFSPVVPSPLTAVVDLAPVSGGTDVRVECQYADVTAGEPYSVWVVDTRGQGSEVKPWTVRPNRVMHPSGVSPLPLDSISAVEIREGDAGQVLLRAQR